MSATQAASRTKVAQIATDAFPASQSSTCNPDPTSRGDRTAPAMAGQEREPERDPRSCLSALRFPGVGILVAATPDRAEDLVGGVAGDMAVLAATQFQLVGPVLADDLAQGRLGFGFLQAHRFSPSPMHATGPTGVPQVFRDHPPNRLSRARKPAALAVKIASRRSAVRCQSSSSRS